MARSATDVMHDVIYAAVIDAVGALKSGAGNLPNTILRDLGAIHANTTYADLPEALRKAIEASVRAAFTRLHKEGYSVGPAAAPPRPAGPRSDGPPRDRPARGPQGRPPARRPSGGAAAGGAGRDPGGAPRPGGARPQGGPRPPRKPGGPQPR